VRPFSKSYVRCDLGWSKGVRVSKSPRSFTI
jgi:hypothetical protein